MRRMYKKDGIYVPKQLVDLRVAEVIFNLGRSVYRRKDGKEGAGEREDVRRLRKMSKRTCSFEEASRGLTGLYVDIA